MDGGIVTFLVTGAFIAVLYYPHLWVLTAFTAVGLRLVETEASRATSDSSRDTRAGAGHAPGDGGRLEGFQDARMITARALARRAVSAAAYYSGLEEQRHRVAMQDRGVVLMYHRVLPDAPHPGVDPGMFVTASAFEHHLRLLRSRYDLSPSTRLASGWPGSVS